MKTIDVQDGDTWTMWPFDPGLYQYRAGGWRYVTKDDVAGSWGQTHKSDTEVSLPACAALAILTEWGYTITKPEQADKPTSVVFPLEGATRTVEYPSEYEARKAAAVGNGRVVKPDATTDVPVVDAVWVDRKLSDGTRVLWTFRDDESAQKYCGPELRNGTARIVRLAADPDLAATVKRLVERVATAEADRAALLLFVLQAEEKLGITESNRHPVVADALSRAGGK
jgi:hypothetical protein